MNREFLIFDPRFVEDSVFVALRTRHEQTAYHRERARHYEIADMHEREKRFEQLNRQWFLRLGLSEEIKRSLEEQPTLFSSVRFCVVAQATRKKEEGAELFVNPDPALKDRAKRTLRLLFCPETLLKPTELTTFLRRELFHIVDMLDADFLYEPSLPLAECGPTHDALLRDRYRTLWEITIDGRMSRRGWLPQSARADQFANFTRTFPMLGQASKDIFAFLFDQEPHTHAELVAFAQSGGIAERWPSPSAQPGNRCPLCGFPTHTFEPEPDSLPDETVAAIAQDFSQWRPSLGLCLQCADLYRAREISLLAARELPGANKPSPLPSPGNRERELEAALPSEFPLPPEREG